MACIIFINRMRGGGAGGERERNTLSGRLYRPIHLHAHPDSILTVKRLWVGSVQYMYVHYMPALHLAKRYYSGQRSSPGWKFNKVVPGFGVILGLIFELHFGLKLETPINREFWAGQQSVLFFEAYIQG